MPVIGISGATGRSFKPPSPELRKDREKPKSTPAPVRIDPAPHENAALNRNARRPPAVQVDAPGRPNDGTVSCEPGEEEEIAEDPFFQRYSMARPGHDPLQQIPGLSRHSSSDTEGPLSPGHAKMTQMPSPTTPRSPMGYQDQSGKMQEINVCVLGERGVGKTTFITRILELKSTSTTAFNARKMTIDGTLYLVRLIELDFHSIPDITDEDGITWPDTIDDLATPRIDGAFALYDVKSKESLAKIPETLNAIKKASLPFALMAWKCDTHPAQRQIDPAVVESKARNFLGPVPCFQSFEMNLDVQKRCLSALLGDIVTIREEAPQIAAMRRRANSSAIRPPSQSRNWQKKHERASSEYSGVRMKLDRPDTGDRSPLKSRVGSHTSQKSPTSHKKRASENPQQTFLDLDESPGYASGDACGADSDSDASGGDVAPEERGLTFDQLVTRLLAQPLSKTDTKFQAIFLALYRKFATPGQLLEVISNRFAALERDKKPQMIRTIAQLRHLAILEQWIRLYPGDFAHITTKRKMRRFVTRLVQNRIFSVAAREMMLDLEMVSPDDDTNWACCDRARERPESKLPSTVLDEDSGDEDYVRLFSNVNIDDAQSVAGADIRASIISYAPSTTSSSQILLNNVESAQKQARGLMPIPRTQMTKLQWHTLMGIDEEVIAKELTRIDWIMFSAIRPRDLVRHVSLNNEQKRQCKSLENVNRMIDHFNHLASWVTNYILLRDKPKHRALMMEKFMKIARKVREMNNYNALGAILAGINGTAVHRLAATRELLNPLVAKDFMKLEILMSTQKSHSTYRLAWQNTSGERIPYLPLHRRDLVSAAEGNSTFVGERKPEAPPSGDVHPGTAVFTGRASTQEAPPGGVTGKERINWKKFEIMGEVIVGVQRSQGTPYPHISRNDEVRSLLLEVKLCKDEDELYERSVHLEASASSGARRFGWFKG